VRRALESSIEQIAASIDQLVQIWNQKRHQPDANLAPLPPRDVIQCMQRSAAPGDCTIAELAHRALNCIDHFAHKARSPRARLTRFIPSLLALSLEPFCPSYTRAVRERFPEAATRWTALNPSPVAYDLPRFEAKLSVNAPTLAATSIVADTPSEMI
jgi:hypothetical protein